VAAAAAFSSQRLLFFLFLIPASLQMRFVVVALLIASAVAAPPRVARGRDVESWKRVIRSISPRASAAIVDGVAATMPQLVSQYGLNTPTRQAFFLAQTAEESAGFTTTTEFGSGAEYNGRRDLGNTHPGDGPRYKGRGIIQLTGRSNYAHYGQILHKDLVGNPDLAAKFPVAALSAGEYWKSRGINACADRNDFICATRKVNGGTNGLSVRQQYLAKARTALLR
jgi:putative chitinase